MSDIKFVKLVDLAKEDYFKVEKVWGYKWKKWDQGQMIVSDTYQKGFQKKYSVQTDKGSLDVSTGQLGQMLEGVFKDGVSDINGKHFSVKTNGKTGMEVRYYINPVKGPEDSKIDASTQFQGQAIQEDPEEIDLSNIPFS